MRRPIAILAVLAISSAFAFGQNYYQANPYAPRQLYGTRPVYPYVNPALTNKYQPRLGVPGVGPMATNLPPGTQANPYAPGQMPTNLLPGSRFVPGNRFAPSPYTFSNVLPRTGYNTNLSAGGLIGTNVSGYVVGTTNYAVPPGSTNFVLPNATNEQSRLAITPSQRQNIDRLTAVLHSIKSLPVTQAQKQQLIGILRLSAQGTSRPSDAALVKLVDDVIAAWPDKAFGYQQKFQLALDFNRTVNCGNLTASETQMVMTDVRRVLVGAKVSEESIKPVVDELNVIAGEVQKTSLKETTAEADPPK